MIETFQSSLPSRGQYLIFCLAIFLSPVETIAKDQRDLSQVYKDTATKEKLWEKTEWLNLLHYNKENNNYISQVDDDRYYYAEDGKINPKAELLATLKHLFIPTDNHNQQTQCQFVARTHWLSQQLKINKSELPSVVCAEYLEWRELIQADSVTMIFPAYHLNSPSSMFGHTLLRLDKSGEAKSEWLSYAVNFGANIDNSDNSLLYAYRGLAGGYPGIFITEPYFKKIQEYNRIEHRDIWEYKLNLTKDETNIMVNHLWELKTINFDYYFFDENCSYRLLELLEVARPSVELTDEFIITAIPVDTVRAIERVGLIEAVNYRPAKATEIQAQLEAMSSKDRNIVYKLSLDIKVTESDIFTNLPADKQKKIAELAYNYLRYQNTEKARNPEIAKRSFQLLKKINTYPKDINSATNIARPVPPEKSHKSKRTSLGLGERLDNKYAELGFKIKATQGTRDFLALEGIESELILKMHEGRPNIIDSIKNGDIQLLINTPSGKLSAHDDSYIRKAAIKYKVPYITTLPAAAAAVKGIAAYRKNKAEVRSLQSYHKEIT